jgi:hypothetical protein
VKPGDLVTVHRAIVDPKWVGMRGIIVRLDSRGPWPIAWVQWENGRIKSFETMNLMLVDRQ